MAGCWRAIQSNLYHDCDEPGQDFFRQIVSDIANMVSFSALYWNLQWI